MKGQMTLTNILYIFVGLYLYIKGLYPILDAALNDLFITMQANPQSWTDATITILSLVPIAIPLGILATIFIYSQPRVG